MLSKVIWTHFETRSETIIGDRDTDGDTSNCENHDGILLCAELSFLLFLVSVDCLPSFRCFLSLFFRPLSNPVLHPPAYLLFLPLHYPCHILLFALIFSAHWDAKLF